MQENKLIHEFQKNPHERVKVELGTYCGTDVINIRVYYNAGENEDDWRPSRKGISMSVGLIPELKKAINLAYDEWEYQINKSNQ